MWRPGFDYAEACEAELVGYARAFCVYSTHHRGTAQRPGLVLGLDSGGTCHGLAFRVAPEKRSEVLDYLRAREQVNGVYREVLAPVSVMRDNRAEHVWAVFYVVERAHPSYAGHMPLRHQARIIRSAWGLSGPNVDYLAKTLRRAQALSLPCRDLQRLMVLIGPYFQRAASYDPGGNSRASPQAKALVAACRPRRAGPRQPNIGERRRFRFRMNREAWSLTS